MIDNFRRRFFQFAAKNDGWAESLQNHRDGVADHMGFRMAELPRCRALMSCTPDQNAPGLALPCASGIEGYLKGKAGKQCPHPGARRDLVRGL
ncbi:hypothetical protein E0H35_33645 [Rhizobium leguminosarum bv. viciae]|uniref:hypothetical protein n=1 Tax=Rhizobium TaxID=379 RepID=UPI0010313EC1|nr:MULTISPECIES: hypothetical protein [Rhizobium]MBY5344887.1 hypothetical protein [Rhizobium leguminosarum]MBY5481203.1 hypothetical protein [Rhizobium leguminosarum]TAW70040.1 hypothetical protein ELI11_36100 [Rhizobium ruizarguesonis]TBY26985.1 hypothetical protein E0H55_29085 [Rhizobium leguminosarum bv. viciae]TBY88422.1 hypothetical protein E0H35_33645 [Rhizobium leguminosarum bv. viciae]